MNHNTINEVWQRIIDHSVEPGVKPNKNQIFYTVARNIPFWIEKQGNNIMPKNDKKSNLFQITKQIIRHDIDMGVATNSQIKTSDLGTPAPSYRYALLNDPRIWFK